MLRRIMISNVSVALYEPRDDLLTLWNFIPAPACDRLLSDKLGVLIYLQLVDIVDHLLLDSNDIGRREIFMKLFMNTIVC